MMATKRILKRVAYTMGLMDVMSRVSNGAPLILMYHSITSDTPECQRARDGNNVSASSFVEQLRLIKQYRKIIGLTEMVDGIRSGQNLGKTAAITFDDGYENNSRLAATILTDFNVPASFFLATGYVGTDRWMWTDQLCRMLERTDRKVVMVRGLPMGISLANPLERREGLKAIKAHFKKQPIDVSERDINELQRDLGLSEEPPFGDYRFMSWQMAREMARNGFEVGAHTVNHPILSRIPMEEAFKEILASRDRVQAEIGKCCEVFCYPNGKSGDYTAEIMAFCRKHFRAALSTNRGPARAEDLYELRRIGISGNTTVSEFAWCLLKEH